MEIKYYHVDLKSHNFIILRDINSEPHPRSLIIREYDILITHDINVYRNICSQDLDDIIAKYPNLWIDIGRTIDVPEDI
jgi:hypothetical protein